MAAMKPSTPESIKQSDGGVSEPCSACPCAWARVYQAFRWWGVGTQFHDGGHLAASLSSIPMVRCRNIDGLTIDTVVESIKHSDGGVSEHYTTGITAINGVYQAFRWWGVGTS